MVRVCEVRPVLNPLPKPLLLKPKPPARFAVRQVAPKRVAKLVEPYAHGVLAPRGTRLHQLHCDGQKQGLYARNAKKLLCAVRRVRRLTRVPAQVRRSLLKKTCKFFDE